MASNKTSNKTTARAASGSAPDWTAEAKAIDAAARKLGGSRGDQLARAGKVAAEDSPRGKLIRAACGDAGAQALIDQPRNVLAKLPHLAECIASGREYCSAHGMTVEGKRKEDASVPVALAALGAGNERQKEIAAVASTRYPGGAGAQMPAALGACAFFGIVSRLDPANKRNAGYAIADAKRAEKLMPQA